MTRISVCATSINSKYDVETFVKHLALHNSDVEYEVCLTHDDRVDDGSTEYFAELQRKHPELKVVKNTHEDTVEYLRRLMDYYDRRSIFRDNFRQDLRRNVELFAERQLFDHRRSFLWLTSGVLYNKAVSISSGELLIVTPADFLYLFKLKDLRDFVLPRMADGGFYSKPGAVWARISTQDQDWVRNKVAEVHAGKGFREGYRWDCTEFFRDYLRHPAELKDFYLPDIRNNRLISLGDTSAWPQVYQFNRESFSGGGVQVIPSFHGYHVMTRKTYEAIGGFTTEYYGRAFADDKMTYLGKRQRNSIPLPNEFSVAWLGQAEISPYQGQGYPPNWHEQLQAKDPYWDRHPIPSSDGPTYLHHGLVNNSQMAELVNASFNRTLPPVRIDI